MRRRVTPLATPIAWACSYPYLRLFFCHFNTNKTLEQKLKASMATTSLHRAFIEHSIIIQPSEPHIYSWTYTFTLSGFTTELKAALKERNSTGQSWLYNHDGFNVLTETDGEGEIICVHLKPELSPRGHDHTNSQTHTPNVLSALANKAFSFI